MPQSSQANCVLKPSRRHGRPSIDQSPPPAGRGHLCTGRSIVHEHEAPSLPLAEGRFQRIAERAARARAGGEAIDDDVDAAVARNADVEVADGCPSPGLEPTAVAAAPSRSTISPGDDRADKAFFPQRGQGRRPDRFPRRRVQGEGDHVPRAGGRAASRSAALCGVSQRTSCPHLRQEHVPILANNSRR